MSCKEHLRSKGTLLLLALVPALLAAAALASLPDKKQERDPQERAAATGYAKSLSQAFREAAAEVQPSVVLIKSDAVMPIEWKGQGEPGGGRLEKRWFGETPFGEMPELKRFFEQMPQIPEVPDRGRSGIGSGVIIDASGVILTNNHVVEGRNEITVRLYDGQEFKAVDVKTDPNTDLAVVRIEGAGDLEPATLGDSDQVEVGDWVLALGHPFGLEGTVTSGIVSAKGRGIGMPARAAFLQTDAAINPGNSGGPLVSLDGHVIGINTAISSRSGGNQGVGFAVPANLAAWVSRQLIDNGEVRRAQLGVMIQPITPALAEEFGVEAAEGVLVAEVSPETPAARAGLESGDVIVEYDGQSVASPRELQAAVERSEVGRQHELVVIRDGKRQTLEAKPREAPAADRPAASRQSPSRQQPSRLEQLGIEVDKLTPEVAERLGVRADRGAVITDVLGGSPADRAGLEAGMVVLEADRKPVASADDLRKALEAGDGGGVLLLVRSEQGSRFLVVRNEG